MSPLEFMKKFIFFILLVGGVCAGIFVNKNAPSSEVNDKVLAISESVSPHQEEKLPSPSIPQSIKIPSLGVAANIESVTEDDEGRMDVPEDPLNTAWYSLGAMPGEKGNAVIAGHLDTPSGDPSVFYDIDSLNVGDKIITIDEKGTEYVFAVVDVKTYDNEEFPLLEVFGSYEKQRLNLITCAGTFDSTLSDYSDRTVVYSELVEVNEI